MQLIEGSVIGLRAARFELTSRNCQARVTLFCMAHIGTAGFYDEVYTLAGRHDVVLLEGVRSKVVGKLTRSYRWIRTERIGLVVQPRPSFPPSCRVVHGDISGEEFDALWRKVPWWERAGLLLAATYFGIWFRSFGTKDLLARELTLNDFPSRNMIFAPDPIVHIVMDARDAHLCRRLQQVIKDADDRPLSVAVVYGAAHMPAVIRFLADWRGFAIADSAWMDVFRF